LSVAGRDTREFLLTAGYWQLSPEKKKPHTVSGAGFVGISVRLED
jgi:hypothetical protein